jgi:AraC-like DNA-binding protein
LPLSATLPPPYLCIKLEVPARRRILSQSFLHEKYIKEGLQIEHIAALANSSSYAVKKRLNKFGLIETHIRQHQQAEQKARSLAEIKRLR